jgi:hypothetical protein
VASRLESDPRTRPRAVHLDHPHRAHLPDRAGRPAGRELAGTLATRPHPPDPDELAQLARAPDYLDDHLLHELHIDPPGE